MPIFEFICKDCSKEFEFLTHGQETPKCPACSGANLTKKFSTFSSMNQKSASDKACDYGEPCGGCACKTDCSHGH